MLSKNQIKLINSLKKKKTRTKYNLFLAEGIKVVKEFISSNYKLHKLYHTLEYIPNFKTEKNQIISDKELKRISQFSAPNQILAIFEIPLQEQSKDHRLTLVLDEINDPGNLGTIIRLCDWFDIKQIVCSTNTVDCFNPKVVQASMGSLSRVSMHYCDLIHFLKNDKRPIYGALLNGEDVYKTTLPTKAVLVMGNEANGISNEVINLITNKLTIPQFGESQNTESLNVASATAILLSEFKR